MRFLITTAAKDLKRILRDPVGLSAWALMPLILCTLLALISGGGNPTPQGKLLIVDHDQTLLSGLLGNLFSREPLSKMVQTESASDQAAARQRMDAGEASALLIIPAGFGQKFLLRQPVELTLLTNPSERITPAIIRDVLATALEAGFYLQQIAGPEFSSSSGVAPSDAEVLRTSIALNQLGRQAGAYFFPPLIKVETNVVATKHNDTPLVVLFYPGLLLLAVFGVAQSSTEDLWKERRSGTLRRIRATPQALAIFLAGKILAAAVIFFGIATAGLALAHFALHAVTRNAPVAVLWVTASGVMLYLIAAVLQVFSSEQRTGVIVNSLVLFVFAMLGGTFFPFELMPASLAKIGRFTPNGWAISHFKQMASQSLDGLAATLDFVILAALITGGFIILTRRVRNWSL